jgi:hypothetical protein
VCALVAPADEAAPSAASLVVRACDGRAKRGGIADTGHLRTLDFQLSHLRVCAHVRVCV